MWNPFSRKVTVEFIERSTGIVFDRSDIPTKQLPDTFAIETTLHLQDGDWRVVDAAPPTKEEFSKSGRLRLWLEKAERVAMVNPADLLYTLPTISNDLPANDGGDVDGTEMRMHEDDWRQIEWVDNVPEVEAELARIRAIHTEQRVGSWFKTVHVRELIPRPLCAARLDLTGVLSWLGRDKRELRSIRINDEKNRVRDGFAIKVEDGWVYGLASRSREGNEHVSVLGFHPEKPTPAVAVPTGTLSASAVLVDWCRAARWDSEAEPMSLS